MHRSLKLCSELRMRANLHFTSQRLCVTCIAVMSSYDEAKQTRPITFSRVINLVLIFLFAAVVVLHVVCLAVMAAKHNEIVDKLSDEQDRGDDIKGNCILFMNYDERHVKWVNNKCHLVIYGSGALGGCALLMILFLIMRTLLFRK